MNGLDFGTAIGLIKGLGSPDPAVIESAVSDWLDDHPEATTTVQDGSITKAKLDSNLQGTVDDVANLKSEINSITEEQTTFIDVVRSENLLNPANWVSGAYILGNGTVTANTGASYVFIPLDGAGNYRISGDKSLLGVNVIYFPSYSEADTTKFVQRITGTIIDDSVLANTIIGFEITDAMISAGVSYIALSKKSFNITGAMCVKGTTYPATYINYFDPYDVFPRLRISDSNLSGAFKRTPLFQKKAIFDGDSICQGTGTQTETVGRGWAGRIGDPNDMEYYNYGSGGGTIVTGTYFDGGAARHWISTAVDTIHSSHTDCDYYVFDGGTNDADILGDSRTSEKFGTLDMTNFSGPFDTTVFTEAMDYLCMKLLTYYPKAKIGYIVAQKMGTGPSGYDEANNNRYRYFVRAMEVCKKWGIPVVNIWDGGQLNPKLTSYYKGTVQTQADALAEGYAYYDGQHLTNIGYDIITPKIEAWMESM